MKPCEPIYEHIDQEEFGDGKKITTSLLKRYCSNISGLWKKTDELEDNTDPELRKRFTPPTIHDLHSYGVRLNSNNEYEFDNSTETIFTDAIGLKTIEITDLQKKDDLYIKKLENTSTIAKISINKDENIYPSLKTLEALKNGNYGYFIDINENNLYIKTLATETISKVLAKVYSDDPFIERKNTTAHVNLAENKIHAPFSEEQFAEEVLDQNTAIQYTIDANGKEVASMRGVEKYWNFGWRKFNHFWMYPLWLQDPFNENPNTPPIPTVARAFIIKPRNTGLLSKIRLMFNVKPGAEDEAYCEIRETTPEGYPSIKILTREKTKIRGTSNPILHTIPFTAPTLLEKDKKYVVVVRAGFTSSDNSYGLGGWSFATYGSEFIGNILHKAEAKVQHDNTDVWKRINNFDEDILSDIFHSTDNCVSWTKAHSISLAGFVEDAFDGMRPRAFSYQTFIRPLKEKATLTAGESIVYWKPITTNPIQSIQLIPTSPAEGIKWEISVNMVDWHQLTHPQWDYNFKEDGDSYERDQNQLYIRAKITTDTHKNPEITGLKTVIKTRPADTAYLKTLFYNPRLGNLLGASLWSSLGTEITVNPPLTDKIDIKIDVIQNKVMKDVITCNGRHMTFKLTEKPNKPLIKVTMLPSTLYLQTEEHETTSTTPSTLSPKDKQKIDNLTSIMEKVDIMYEEVKKKNEKSSNETMGELANHFINVNGIIDKLITSPGLIMLKESVKLLKTLEDCDKSECLLNYMIMLRNAIINTINLIKTPNRKYIDIVPQIPGHEGMNLELTENRDYTVNYEEGTITLNNAWGIGTLKAEYYPLWLQGLHLTDFPFRTDFITEKFHTKEFILKTAPLDPLRSIEQYHQEKNEWTELTENTDYTVDYSKKKIKIVTKNEADQYRVKYTPYLIDEGLALAYRMKRTDKSHQAAIKSCYFQNRV